MHLIYFFFLFFVPLCVQAKDSEPKEQFIILPAGEVYQGDYFAMGDHVEISGTVNGDVYVLAEQVSIDGTVNGDVLACAGSIDISGNVLRNCRLLAGQVLISGAVGNNVTALAANTQLLSSAEIKGGIVAVTGNSDFAAPIGENAMIIASNLRFSSHIQRNLQAVVGHMRITSRAVVGGNVDYRSHYAAEIDPGAQITGELIYHPSFVQELVKGTWIQGLMVGSKILVLLMNFLYTFIIGLILLKVFPRNLESALDVLKNHPFKAFCYGLMLLILLPLAALILLMTILGIPFALALVAFNVVTFYTAKIYCIFWGANWILPRLGLKSSRLPAYFCGLIFYFLLTSIPVFGIILSFSAMVFGIGAGALSQVRWLSTK